MYLSEKPRPIDFYKESSSPPDRDMIIETLPPPPHHHHHLILGDSSGGEEPEIKAPKKRAETWVQEETRSLINFRREVDGLFNTSKSNKHLWEQISSKMRDKGFDRSPTMCTDKWRNLLKEFKKARQLAKGGGGGGRSAKMTYYEELEELLRDRTKNNGGYKSPNSLKVDPFIQFSDKSLDDANIPFGSLEANDRSTVNMERRLDSDSDPLAITAADAVGASGVAPWNWRETPGNVAEAHSYCGRIITVKLGDYTRRIGIDGTAEAIKEAIKSAFRIRTKRAFWLEDEDQVVRSLDREMPLGNYTLHLDEGITIKICLYDDNDPVVRTEEVTFYTEDDFRDFLNRRGLSGLREMTNCLREMTNYRRIDTMDDLHSGAMYQGVRLLGD